jgi:EAL domain-containing protein (putative c-di-GMP-specific phosphodiesterase class I)
MKLVAEGVESQGQLEYLKSRGCQELQGFLFSRPVSAREISALLENEKSSNPTHLTSVK